MRKRILAVALALMLLIGGCYSEGEGGADTPKASTEEKAPEKKEENKPEEKKEEPEKTQEKTEETENPKSEEGSPKEESNSETEKEDDTSERNQETAEEPKDDDSNGAVENIPDEDAPFEGMKPDEDIEVEDIAAASEATAQIHVYLSDAEKSGDIYVVYVSGEDSIVSIGWNASDTMGNYSVTIKAGDGTVASTTTGDTSFSLEAAKMIDKDCEATVSAKGINGGNVSDRVSFTVCLHQNEEDKDADSEENEGGDGNASDNPTVPVWLENATEENGVWTVNTSRDKKELVIGWLPEAEDRAYTVTVTNDRNEVIFSGEPTQGSSLSIPTEMIKDGVFTLTVTSENEDGEPVVYTILFTVAQQDGPGGFPGFHGGFHFGGKGRFGFFGSFAGMTGGAPEEYVFTIVPGVALTDTHARGDKDMSLYGTVSLEVEPVQMTALVVGGETFRIARTDEEVFTAFIEDDRLILDAEGKADAEWQMNGRALKTLCESGVREIILRDESGDTVIPTEVRHSGKTYAKLCAQGYVSHDYTYVCKGGEKAVTVDGQSYDLNDDGTMERNGDKA